MKLFSKILAALAIIGLSSAVYALSDSQRAAIAERLKPVGEVCLMGDSSCAVAMAKVAAGPQAPEDVYGKACAGCHDTGAAGAPKKGDAVAWDERLAVRELDVIYDNAINGYNSMPAMGLCMDCSEDDIRNTIDYILANSK